VTRRLAHGQRRGRTLSACAHYEKARAGETGSGRCQRATLAACYGDGHAVLRTLSACGCPSDTGLDATQRHPSGGKAHGAWRTVDGGYARTRGA
jgi:hypothetical protein